MNIIKYAPGTIIGYRKNGKPIYVVAGGSVDSGYTGGDAGQQGTGDQGGSNPAWNDLLNEVPQEFHHKVTPVLQNWDRGVQDRFQKVHSEYEPWQAVIKSGTDPETTQFALNLLNSVNNNPEMVYNALKDYYKFDQQSTQFNGSQNGQGQQEPQVVDPYQQQFQQYDQRFQELQRQNQIMANVLWEQQTKEQNIQADRQLDKELSSLKSKYGNYDERYVLAMMQNGMSSEDAVRQYHSFAENVAKTHTPRPLIMGGGGSVPGQSVDVKKLSDAGTKDIVVQMLAAAAQQNRQS